MISKLLRTEVQTIKTYIPSPTLEQISQEIGIPMEKIAKLDSGENPYGERLLDKGMLKNINFFTYPDPTCSKLRKKLSNYTGYDPEWITCGNGSDELIDLLIRIFASPGNDIIVSPPTFPMYTFYGQLNGAKVKNVLRKKDLTIDGEKIRETISSKTKLIFIDSPGNPSGTIIKRNTLEKLLTRKTIIVVDEAYYEYCGETVLPLVEKYENLIVLRTFSKWAGLAGLRVGYCVANPKIIQILSTVKSPYNVNTVAQEMACFVLDRKEKVLEEVNAMVKYRKKAIKDLQTITQLTVYPSDGAYIIFQPKDLAKLQTYLKQKGIFVKLISQPLLTNCIRVNIAKEKEMKLFTSFVRRFYEKRTV